MTLSFTEAVDGATVPLRMSSPRPPCKACSGTGDKNGTPRVCPTCVGTGQVSRGGGGGFSLTDPCVDCKGRGLIAQDPCDDLQGQRAGDQSRAPCRSASPRASATGSGSGCAARAPRASAAARPATCTSSSTSTRTRSSAARATTSRSPCPVTFPEAALGGEIKVPTLGGPPVTLKLPPGTPNGRTMRARGKGAVRKDGTRGDLLVTVEVAVPKELSDKAKDALESYRDATAGEDPRAALFKAAKGALRWTAGPTSTGSVGNAPTS